MAGLQYTYGTPSDIDSRCERKVQQDELRRLQRQQQQHHQHQHNQQVHHMLRPQSNNHIIIPPPYHNHHNNSHHHIMMNNDDDDEEEGLPLTPLPIQSQGDWRQKMCLRIVFGSLATVTGITAIFILWLYLWSYFV